MANLPSYVFVVGPTCTGKTRLSLAIAESIDCPIINTDSVQVYKDVNIGTAKPTLEERQRVPHYLFDVVETGELMTAADYVHQVVELCRQQSFANALFVGGSGFYIQALEKGLYPNITTSEPIKQKVADLISEIGYDGLYAEIQKRDPDYAQAISINDHYRIGRAMEVLLSQNKKISELKEEMAEKAESPLPAHRRLKVGLIMDRDQQRPLVKQRCKQMLDQGLIQEVQALVSKGLSDWSPLSSVGYKEVSQYLRGELPEQELLERMTIATMQLIKKQTTWFRRDPDIRWFQADQWEETRSYVLSWLDS